MIHRLYFKTCYILCLSFLAQGFCNAQAFSTNGTKAVLIMETEPESISKVILFADFQKMSPNELTEEYPTMDFYLGIIDGSYEVSGFEVIPTLNSTVIMYTEKLLFPGVYYKIRKSMIPGSRFNIGKVKAKIVSAKQDELIIKI